MLNDDSELDYGDFENHIASTDPQDTLKEWERLLYFCEKEYHVGFGFLDSFLSGPDIENRIDLVEEEIKKNSWLRLELFDTVGILLSSNATNETLIGAIRKTP